MKFLTSILILSLLIILAACGEAIEDENQAKDPEAVRTGQVITGESTKLARFLMDKQFCTLNIIRNTDRASQYRGVLAFYSNGRMKGGELNVTRGGLEDYYQGVWGASEDSVTVQTDDSGTKSAKVTIGNRNITIYFIHNGEESAEEYYECRGVIK